MRRLSHWLSTSNTRPAKARDHRARLSVSRLESREVMSAVLADGVLTVTGDDGGVARSDTIEIFSPQDGRMVVRVNGVDQFSGSNAISRLEIDGRGRNDQVTIRGVQSGITDGVVVRNSETVTVGERNPLTGRFSMGKLRSDLRVEDARALNLRDTASTAARTVVVGDQEVTGLAPGEVSYSFNSGSTMTIQTGSGAETFQIDRTPQARTRLFGGGGADTFDLRRSVGDVEITGEAGVDTVNVAAAGQSLADVFGRVTVNDGSFQDRVTIHDQRTGGNVDFFDSYTATLADNRLTLAVGARTEVNGQVISRSFNRTIDFNGVDSVDFRAAARTATALSAGIQVQSVARFTETQVDVGGVSETRLGSGGSTLDGILGRTTLTGGQDDSRVILDDGGQVSARAYRVGATRITQPIELGERDINYGAFRGLVSVRAGSANDRFTVDGQRADGRSVSVFGNGGRDTVVGPNQDNAWLVIGNSFGILNEQILFFETDNLLGRTRDDTFRFLRLGRIDGQINGAGGFDTLDYSEFNTGVTVNLGNGLATGIGLGALNIRNVFGGSAADALTGNNLFNVLVGNGGNDVLNGGTGGRDVLIGGAGGDTLTKAGGGDTIYIGGDVAAADRNNVGSMKAIMTEWLGGAPLPTRVDNLAAGVGPGGAVRLNADVLDGDGVTDTFVGTFTPDAFYREAVDAFSGAFLPGLADRVISV